MKKNFIALFAACSMVATASVGLVQTAYADGAPNFSVVVTDGATDNEKVLTFYYDCEGTYGFQGTLSFTGGDVTINSVSVPLTYPAGMGDKAQEIAADKKTANIGLAYYDDGALTTADKSFATATVTVPGDVDITANFDLEFFTDENWGYYTEEIETISTTIPASTPVVPVEETYDKGYVFTTSNDVASKKFTTLKVNVIDKENNNAPGYAEENIADQIATITGPAALTIFIKNIPAAYEVTSVELN